MDQAAAALIRDLKRRGLLDETLVVWGGEFGRTPVSESGTGRDHNPYGFTMWMAGGGFKGGLAYGATDEFGFKAVENRVSIHDLHATMLAPARHRPHQADLPLRRPRFPADRRVHGNRYRLAAHRAGGPAVAVQSCGQAAQLLSYCKFSAPRRSNRAVKLWAELGTR